MNVPATGSAAVVGGLKSAVLSSDWLCCNPLPVFSVLHASAHSQSKVDVEVALKPRKIRLMAKRRAENTLLLDSPGKRKYSRPLCSVDVQLENSVPPTTGGVSPPSLLALLGSRCRKRPHYFENEEKPGEAVPSLKSSLCTSKKVSADDLTERISGSFQGRSRISSCTVSNEKKRTRVDSIGSDTIIATVNEKTVEDPPTEDSIYNSFQYWRVPLPELDLSLLDEPSNDPQTKINSKVSGSSDTMET